MEPGKKLLAMREAAKLSQAELARRVRCNQTLIGAIEREQKFPGIRVALGLARVSKDWPGGPIKVGEWARAKQRKQSAAHVQSVATSTEVREARS